VHASGLNGVLAAKEPATTAHVHALRNAIPQAVGRASLRSGDQDAHLARGVGQWVRPAIALRRRDISRPAAL
jgi:hypothetical protein